MRPQPSQILWPLSLLLICVGCTKGDTLNVDDDGDGYSELEGDCDDGDASIGPEDLDGDGYSTCDGDCDDNDAVGCLGHPGGGGMLLIPAGTFEMGCTTEQEATGECDLDESPVHTVALTHDFYMGETEVTQAEYVAIMGTNPSYFLGCGTDCPVERISWHEMAEYANALSALEGLAECFTCLDGDCSTLDSPYSCDGYRLPTEAEWEYAARAGTNHVYSGSDIASDVGWYESNSEATTHPVAQKAPNDWGLYDMSGNVWECTWDWYDPDYYSTSSPSDPEAFTSASYRVERGGSWLYDVSSTRVSYRGITAPAYRYSFIGFRLTRSIQ